MVAAKSIFISVTNATLDKWLHFFVKAFLSGSTYVSVSMDSTTHADEPYLDLSRPLPHNKLLQNKTCYLQNMLSEKKHFVLYQFRSVAVQKYQNQNCLKKITTPCIHVKWPDFLYISVSNINWWKSVERNFHQFTIREREKVGNVPWLPIQR